MNTFKILYEDKAHEAVFRIVGKRLTDRGLRESEDAALCIRLLTDPTLRTDSFRLVGEGGAITVSADCTLNLLAGCGYLLLNSRFDEDGIVLTDKRGTVCPDCHARGLYMATHFHTYYTTAPIGEVLTYVEDMALIGISELYFPMPAVNLTNASEEQRRAAFLRCAEVMKYARSLGMRLIGSLSTGIVPNAPKELLATPIPDEMHKRGNAGIKVCPAKGQAFLDEYNRNSLQEYKDAGIVFDVLSTFPYDEGGCGCKECDPWGAVGYLRAAKSGLAVAREFCPDAKLNLSTWLFDYPDKGEWRALFDSLQTERWAAYIEADSHDAFPRYPLEHEIPEGVILRAFPEITMWGLWPWGGYGAHFFPHRYTGIWRSTAGKLGGGRMYSEGIFEDLNKYTVACLYRDYNADPDEGAKQYGAYFCGCNDGEAFAELVRCIETNTVRCATSTGVISMTKETNKSDFSLAERAFALAKQIDASLPDWGKRNFRWRLIYLRAVIDFYRYQNVILHECAPVREAMEEISEIYYCLKDYRIADDPFHLKLRPPLPIYDPDFRPEDYPNIGSLQMAYGAGLILGCEGGARTATVTAANQA